MGYYDEPDTLDTTVSFTCSNEECGHENEDVDVSVWATSDTAEDVPCAKCGDLNTVKLGDDSGCICVSDYCRC